jgi:hypothetical protein
MLLIAFLIRVTSPGPAIFRQVRCGLNGRRFTFYKFRSMCDNAEELKASLMHLNRKSTAFKIPNDPRLTPVGRFLRKFSIDEWPQLWNVLKGEMSLVGPRPAVADASGIDVLVGAGWARPAGFRYLDEDGYAVHRQLVFGTGYQDSFADHPSGFDGVGGELTRLTAKMLWLSEHPTYCETCW